MPGELKVSAVEALIKPWCRGNLVAGRAERWPRWSLGLGGVGWRRRRDPGSGQFAVEDPRISSICPVVWKEKMRSVIMAREQAELWKTRDNGGKAAWLFIGVLSSVYWVSDVITDDELAVLIMRACSSRNLFVKHHFFALNNLLTQTSLHFCTTGQLTSSKHAKCTLFIIRLVCLSVPTYCILMQLNSVFIYVFYCFCCQTRGWIWNSDWNVAH